MYCHRYPHLLDLLRDLLFFQENWEKTVFTDLFKTADNQGRSPVFSPRSGSLGLRRMETECRELGAESHWRVCTIDSIWVCHSFSN